MLMGHKISGQGKKIVGNWQSSVGNGRKRVGCKMKRALMNIIGDSASFPVFWKFEVG